MQNAIGCEAGLADILATADAEVHGMRNYDTPCYCTLYLYFNNANVLVSIEAVTSNFLNISIGRVSALS